MTSARFHNFLHSHGVSSLDLLVAGRLFVVLFIVISLALSYRVAARMLGVFPALFAFLLLAFDPFSVGLSRLLHVDGLLSALVLLSLLAFHAYRDHGRRAADLALSAVAAGFAWLTKSPAFFLIPFFGLLLLVKWLQTAPFDDWAGELFLRNTWRVLVPFLSWLVLAVLVFVVFWPAMWVDPLGTLARVFSQAATYASEGHDHPGFFYGRIYPAGESAWYFYPVIYLWRVTPVTLVGLVLAGVALLFPHILPVSGQRRRLMGILLLFAFLFMLFMSLGAKKFDRYLLPAFGPLDIVAALGWLGLVEGRLLPARRLAGSALLAGALLVQVAGVMWTYPYYLNYYNPLMGGHRQAAKVLLVGWGEGLDQAAYFLNTAERNEKTRAIAWYGDGCFSYFYDGVTVPIGLDMTLSDLRRTDYVVLYRNQWERQLPSAAFISYFDELDPVFTVWIEGVEYVRIYKFNG
jgi:4-amino-4-deoxy-L-arabinose transferase-like glycosyltransferase